MDVERHLLKLGLSISQSLKISSSLCYYRAVPVTADVGSNTPLHRLGVHAGAPGSMKLELTGNHIMACHGLTDHLAGQLGAFALPTCQYGVLSRLKFLNL